MTARSDRGWRAPFSVALLRSSGSPGSGSFCFGLLPVSFLSFSFLFPYRVCGCRRGALFRYFGRSDSPGCAARQRAPFPDGRGSTKDKYSLSCGGVSATRLSVPCPLAV